MSHYVSAKHGVIGLMRSLAVELGPHSIRVNSVLPTNVNTPMFMNEGTFKLFRPDLENPGRDDLAVVAMIMHVAADRLGRAGGHQQRHRSSWPPTRPATSPASPSPSTAAPS